MRTLIVFATIVGSACVIEEPELDRSESNALVVWVDSMDKFYGEWGELVTMKGFGFRTLNGWNVEFNGTPSPLSIISDTLMTTTVPAGATHGRPLLRNGSATYNLPVFDFVIVDRSLVEPSASSVTQIADNALRLDFTDTVNTTHDGYLVNIYDGGPSVDASRQIQLGPSERSVLVTFGPSDAPFEVGHLYVFELAPTGPRGVALDWANPWITMSTTARVTRNASASTVHGSAGHDDTDRDGVVDRASAGSSRFRYPFDNRRLSILPENWDVVEGSAFHSEPGLVTNTIALALTDGGTRFIAFHFDRNDPACRGVLLEGDKFSVFVDPLPIVERCDPNGTGISIKVRGFGTDPWIKTETMSLETQLVLERE